ncbi:glycosyltransferase [Anatilimnocola floriformis]|uniref:glycosyltransferase n=1 Tax=Anatilimnocola floriformis TaxID=2948575 RepID=UPI0020C33E56|nr:nucleotide disphospho-sugar-binding domain-containing protein [Anatilimnocola floriformis]
MAHYGVICPNASGHLNPVSGLATELRARGHRVTFCLLGDPPQSITALGFEVLPIGGDLISPAEYRAAMAKLGVLTGRAALKHTFDLAIRGTEVMLAAGPAVIERAGITHMIVDQGSFAGGTVADQLKLPFATVCNALLLHGEPSVPPFFTTWPYRDAWWARLRNRLAWAGLNRLYQPILRMIQTRRRELGLNVPEHIAETWSSRLQLCQQPASFDFHRRELPAALRYVGPLHQADAHAANPAAANFPWSRLSDKPLVYASLGTLQNQLQYVFRAILAGLADLDIQLVLALGKKDAVWNEPTPANAIVVGYAPQLELIERASLVITHAGLNTALETLTRGKPMVCIPVTNDQPGVAARVVHVGAGELLPLKKVTAARLRELTQRVFAQPRYREAAERIQAEIVAAGGARTAANLVERM